MAPLASGWQLLDEVSVMRQTFAVAIGLLLAAISGAGCSSSSASAPGAAETRKLTPSVSVQKTAKGTRIFGPQLELVRDEDGIRGQAPAGIVDLHEQKNGFAGVIGTGTTNMKVESSADGGFNMRGMFAGALGDLEVRSDRIHGQLGRCQFDLRAAPDASYAYNGQRWCGRASASTTLTLTPEIAALGPLDKGALIAIMLSR
jgi:hypothetical protein